jgi:hypothetical protein
MSKHEKGPSIVTHIGGHQFSNLTNYNITISIFDLNVVTNLFSRERGEVHLLGDCI